MLYSKLWRLSTVFEELKSFQGKHAVGMHFGPRTPSPPCKDKVSLMLPWLIEHGWLRRIAGVAPSALFCAGASRSSFRTGSGCFRQTSAKNVSSRGV